jgi:hypothetical protein
VVSYTIAVGIGLVVIVLATVLGIYVSGRSGRLKRGLMTIAMSASPDREKPWYGSPCVLHPAP